MASREGVSARWWGESELDVSATAYWRIGPLELLIERREREWRVARRRDDDPLRSEVVIGNRDHGSLEGDDIEVSRFAFRRTESEMHLAPALADRPVIISPEVELSIPPKEDATFYASSPLWVEISFGESPVLVASEPVIRPSDTWFGPSTVEGEICYSSRTRAQLDIAGTEFLPHRAVSAVTVRNRAPTALVIERVKLPTPNLSLLVDRDGQLRTENVILEREADGDYAALKFGRGTGKSSGLQLVRGPKVRPSRGLSIRSFGKLFQ